MEKGDMREILASSRRWAARAAVWAPVCALAVLGAAGCDDSCAFYLTCPPPPPGPTSGAGGTGGQDTAGGGGAGGGLDCPVDPADGLVSEECGVWVSDSMENDKNPGTQVAPVRTIAAGMALAQGGPMRVYLCGEMYAEAVALFSGVSLFGGFDCQHDWRYLGAPKRALIAPGAAGVVPLTILEGGTFSLVRDINVTSADATEPGGSSIAVFALGGSKVDIQRAEITAGNGADGAKGDDGNHGAPPAAIGLKGQDGADGCSMDVGLGGAAVLITCEDDSTSKGGQGGNGGEGAANDGGDGKEPPNPNPLDYGVGGKGENAISGSACTPGIGGAQGANGAEGSGGVGRGRLTKDGYLGDSGADGGHGLAGQGGGGGGASIGKDACGVAPHGGAGGGSGGTGGCGGRPGKGGQAGGSSIAVASLSRNVLLAEVRLIAGNGGNGGDGGAGQPGGQGGIPGIGGSGLSAQDPVKSGCAGGVGGYGGNGGNGGGGHGGYAVAWACTFDNCPKLGEIEFTFGTPGLGGEGGNKMSGIGRGKDGIDYAAALDP